MINVDYKGVEIGTLPASTSETFVPGRPVTLNATTGNVEAADANCDVLGLCKEALISGTLDEISGQYGIYGSTKISVLTKGICSVQNTVVNGTSYSVYDTTQTYNAGNLLYSDSNGLITTSSSYTGVTNAYLGKVLVAPSNAANGDSMQIEVE